MSAHVLQESLTLALEAATHGPGAHPRGARRVPQPWALLSCVRELDERLRLRV